MVLGWGAMSSPERSPVALGKVGEVGEEGG
jgi:hypothetical protein